MAAPPTLHGTWRLVTWVVEIIDTREQFRQFGDKPPGFIHFTPEGRVFAVLSAEDRSPVKTEADQIAAFGSIVAYTGRYRVEGNTLLTTIDVSVDPAAVGTELVRFYNLEGDTLEINTAPFYSNKPSLGLGDRKLQSFLLWQREGIAS